MDNKVTIAIPTYNREDYLRIALGSALAQTYPNLEIIVSNNASTDKTSDFLKQVDDPRLRILEQEHTISMIENWNACLNAASGKYFLLLSDDDTLYPTAIEDMAAVYRDCEIHGTNVGFVYCRGKIVNADGRVIAEGHRPPESEGARDLVFAFFNSERDLWPCVILFRKEELRPGYTLRFPLGADAVQWIQAVSRHGTARFVDRSLAQYRVHQSATHSAKIDIWRKENDALAEFAIQELRNHHLLRERDVKRLQRAVQRLNVRITSSLINQALKTQKAQALAAYLENYQTFLSPYGTFRLVRGLLALALKSAEESNS
jgi:glycosyltransferase involved in cell wall biosynthesis